MEWKYFFAISAFILTACDPMLGASTIINVTLVAGQTPNEGSVDYLILDDSTWQSVCGVGFGSKDASVICRQLGYPGVNDLTANVIDQWHFGTSSSIGRHKFNCDGEEQNIGSCSILEQSSCSEGGRGGVICYESGYIGCYPYPASPMSVFGDLQTPCENGLQDWTIPKCVSLCNHNNGSFTYAGLYNGNMCLCGNASVIVNASKKVDDDECSSPCTERNIETCGGVYHIALFNSDVTTTVGIQSSSSSTPPATTPSSPSLPSTATPPPPSSPPPSSLSPPPSSLSSPPSPSSPRPTSPSVPSTDRTTTEVMTSDVTPRSRTPTGMPGRTTRGRTTQTGVRNNLGLYIGVGVGGGILLLIVIILLVVFIIRRRRSKDKSASSNHTILELRSRPEGSDLGVYPPPPFSPNNYSLENGNTNMAADDLTTETGVEESDYAMIAETDMNPVKSAINSSAYEDVPRLENTSGSRRPPQPAPRKSAKDTQFTMHPVTSELYTTPDESQLSNGYRDSIPEYAVSQKFRKEPISEAVPQAPPSALGPEDINGLYTMPDKSKKMVKAKKLLDSDMDSAAGIDNALYICRGEDDLQVGETPNEYATDKDGVEVGGEDESDGDTGMVENDLNETSDRPTGGDTGMVENDLYETSHRPI